MSTYNRVSHWSLWVQARTDIEAVKGKIDSLISQHDPKMKHWRVRVRWWDVKRGGWSRCEARWLEERRWCKLDWGELMWREVRWCEVKSRKIYLIRDKREVQCNMCTFMRWNIWRGSIRQACTFVCLSVFLCMLASLCINVHVCMWKCVWMCVHKYDCMNVRVYVCVCMCVKICVCVRILHMCVCLSVDLHIATILRTMLCIYTLRRDL